MLARTHMALAGFALASVLAFSLAAPAAHAVVFTSDAVVGCGVPDFDGDDVVVSGATLTVGCNHVFRSLTLVNGAVVTHAPADPEGVDLRVTSGVLIDATSAIDVRGKGHPGSDLGVGAGPSGGAAARDAAGGGGHGGSGGGSGAAPGGPIRGDPLLPGEIGSGGGGNADGFPAGVGGAGGGRVRLVVDGLLDLEGAILADGEAASGPEHGGGAGGAILLDVSSLSGAGFLRAAGGDSSGAGAGGGGRILVGYGTDAGFLGFGATGAPGGTGAQDGGAGTAAFVERAPGGDHLHVHERFAPGRDAVVALPAVTVHDGGLLRLEGASRLAVDDLTVASGAAISADGSGHPGRPLVPGEGDGGGGSHRTGGGGGGHGAAGGDSAVATGGVAYGDPLEPTELGSGGGGNADDFPRGGGGTGGGAVRVEVSGTLLNDGVVSADGAPAQGPEDGGGAGGSVWITTGRLEGTGLFRADGGSGGSAGGGGAGGRVAIAYDDASSYSAFGSASAAGASGQTPGGRGTVAFIDTSVAGSQLRVFQRMTPPASGALRFERITVEPGGVLEVEGAGALSADRIDVRGGGSIQADGTGEPGGRAAAGAGQGGGATHRSSAGGGGHGGAGGAGTTAAGGGTYGLPDAPTDLGSGGGGNADGFPEGRGGDGGGALRIFARDLLSIEGRVGADGDDATGEESGGGSGGSIWVTAGTIAGAGIVSAAGGEGTTTGGGGGGGRVALYVCDGTSWAGTTDVGGGNGAGDGTFVEPACGTGDDTAPGPVSILIDPAGSGEAVSIDWSAYDLLANGGDIDFFTVHLATTNFADAATVAPITTVPGWKQGFEALGLVRGQQVFVAVVAVDFAGNADTAVTPVATTPVDVEAPEDPAQLDLTPLGDQIDVAFPASTSGDVDRYRVFLDGVPATEIPAGGPLATSLTNLDPASTYLVRVTTVDLDGNESAGISEQAVTFLPNPTGVSAEAFSGRVRVRWDELVPDDLVAAYRVYVDDAAFASVAGRTPVASVPRGANEVEVSGLQNGTTYFIGVTALNVGGGEAPDVTAVSATPLPDTVGPVVGAFRFGASDLLDGFEIAAPGQLEVEASDPSGVARVEFELESAGGAPEVLGVLTGALGVYQLGLDLVGRLPGAYVLRARVFDTQGNETAVPFNVTLTRSPPAAPILTSPESGLLTGNPTVNVSGTAEPDATVILLVNGVAQGALEPNASGAFSSQVPLQVGVNTIVALAINVVGPGPGTLPVSVTLDDSQPESPFAVAAAPRAGGEVLVSWLWDDDGRVARFDVYRSTAPFSDPATAQKLTPTPQVDASLLDLPPSDGTYFYGIVAVTDGGQRSALSEVAEARADSLAPRAVLLAFEAQGPQDPGSGRTGPGGVVVSLEMSEPLLATPFLSIVPDGGVPIPVALFATSDVDYTGAFQITDSTPSGTAFAVLSARDPAGNRGSAIDAGGTLEIDVDGPQMTSLVISPADPIATDAVNPTEVEIDFVLSERPDGDFFDVLTFELSGDGRAPEPIGLPTTTDPDGLLWRALFTLPADAGQAAPEMLAFAFEARDDLGNVGNEIAAPNDFQVFQGSLPPLDPPDGLAASPLPGGDVRFSFDAVGGAASYQVFRTAAGDPAGPLLPLGSPITELEFVDTPPTDGAYVYSVSSIRVVGAQTAESAPRQPGAGVSADSVVPGAPSGLALEFFPQGMQATWAAPAGEPGSTRYRLYRGARDEGVPLDPAGLTPILDDIAQLFALDRSPSDSEFSYVVTAVDSAGNESGPSNTVRLNPGLLPVQNLEVRQTGSSAPLLSFTHPSPSVVAFRVSVDTPGGAVVLGQVATPSFNDATWPGGERIYSVVAIDGGGAESLARTVRLPDAGFTRDDTTLYRGIFNGIDYDVSLASGAAIDGAVLEVEVAGRTLRSEPFDLTAGASAPVQVVVGGRADLAGSEALVARLLVTATTGERSVQERFGAIAVADDTLAYFVEGQNFTKGGLGEVRFRVENTSEIATQILTAVSAGTANSPDVRVLLLDDDDNVLSTTAYLQDTGPGVSRLPNGQTAATVAPGGSFTSSFFSIPVPGNAPDVVRLALEIDRLHVGLGTPAAESIEGGRAFGFQEIEDPAYVGDVTAIDPAISSGDVPVRITGQAIETFSGALVGNAPLEIVLRAGSFEQRIPVVADEDGTFAYDYQPGPTESAAYDVSVIFPGQLARPVHGQFQIGRLLVTPASVIYRSPRNLTTALDLTVSAGPGLSFSGVGLGCPGEPLELPSGIEVTQAGGPLDLGAGGSGVLALTIDALAEAPAAGVFALPICAASAGTDPIAVVPVTFQLSAAAPSVFPVPSLLRAGLVQGETRTRSLRIENRGLAPLVDAAVELLNAQGTGPAAPWITLGSPANLGDVEVGQSRTVLVSFAPAADEPTGFTDFLVRIRGEGEAPVDVPGTASVVQDGEGGVLFHVSDIYTATLDGAGDIIQGLEGARIRIQNEDVATVEFAGETDAFGELAFPVIPAGTYLVRASALDHDDVFRRIEVLPGITSTEEIFLTNRLVTVEWEVREISIEDRYEILLEATFETDVPAAVVVLEPAGVQLPDLKAGETFLGELRVTNHGLIRADGLIANLPQSDEFLRFDFLATLPEVLAAGESLVIPYRITALRDLSPGGASDGTGAGIVGCSYQRPSCVQYRYECANGFIASSATCTNFYRHFQGCGGAWAPSSPPALVGGGGGGGGGPRTSTPRATPISGQCADEICGEDARPYTTKCDIDVGKIVLGVLGALGDFEFGAGDLGSGSCEILHTPVCCESSASTADLQTITGVYDINEVIEDDIPVIAGLIKKALKKIFKKGKFKKLLDNIPDLKVITKITIDASLDVLGVINDCDGRQCPSVRDGGTISYELEGGGFWKVKGKLIGFLGVKGRGDGTIATRVDCDKNELVVTIKQTGVKIRISANILGLPLDDPLLVPVVAPKTVTVRIPLP